MDIEYVFIIFYRDGSRKTVVGRTYRHTNEVVNVIRYISSRMHKECGSCE